MFQPPPNPVDAVARLFDRTNAHDLNGLVACFSVDYLLTNPVHPSRDFRGTEQVRSNWTALFSAIPDLAVSVRDMAVDGEQVWVELALDGTRHDGVHVHLAGVQIFTVRDGLVRNCRFYLEAVEPAGLDADGAIREAAGRP